MNCSTPHRETPFARRFVAQPFGSAPLETEEGRAFLQDRVALVAFALFALSAFAFISSKAVLMHSPDHPLWPCIRDHGGLWHLAGSGISLSVWLATRRGRLSHGALFVVDFAGTLLVLSAYAMMAGTALHHGNNRPDLILLLCSFIILTTRSIIVPSTVWHTLLVSSTGMMPVVLLGYFSIARAPGSFGAVTPILNAAYDGIWAVLGISVAGLASRVIYGLRAEAAHARRLGQYVLEEKIGEGGMGKVYRARHALLRRPTAVKLVLPERAGAETLARFEREVQLTAQLSHPNTVSIFDYGRSPDGVFYYAMEYLDGIDLEALVERFGPQEPARVVHILAQVAGSLAEAHKIGLVHRDVKPANIILCERGGVRDVAKVVDFGLVKDVTGLGRDDPSLSRADTLLGTPAYLAPEALLDPIHIDGRADLYALGAVGYFLLTGCPVFDGASVMDICVKHLYAEPARASERLGRPVPVDLERLLLSCLAKKPEHRPANAASLHAALLACNVPPWTAERADAWWGEHRARDGERTTARSDGEEDSVRVSTHVQRSDPNHDFCRPRSLSEGAA